MSLTCQHANIASSFFGSMDEVYVIARHNFYHFRANQGNFAPFKMLNDSAIFIRPKHSYLNKKMYFK